jgi:protease-4
MFLRAFFAGTAMAAIGTIAGISPPHARGETSAATAQEKEAASQTDAAPRKVRLAHIVVEGSLPESPGEMSLFGDRGVDLRKNIARLDRAAQDDKIAGIVLQVDTAVPRGKLHELRSAIGRVRAAGKKVYAVLESAQGTQYALAAACDEIVMPESGVLVIPGIHAEFAFYKDLLAKLGIEADMLHCGAYKGAAEPYTRDSLSEPVRENMTAMIDDLFDQSVAMLAGDRNLPVETVRKLVDRGLLTAKQAHAEGLVDRVAYPDEFRSSLGESYRADKLVYVMNYAKARVDADFSGPMGMMKMFQTIFGGSKSGGSSRATKVAIVYAVGPIMSGESQVDLFGSSTIGSTTLVEALQTAGKDDSVKAVVLRVDSPGGSALASDLIWRAIQALDKPVVASMGDVAASGGYYLSMGADQIFAEPGTVTGSIGVVGGKLSVKGLYDKIGITTESISRGQNSGLFSPMSKFSDSERAVIESMMQDIYQQFTTKAAQGRNMPHEELLELAGGRIFTGRVAKRNGLVDELGTLKDAVDAAKRLAGIDATQEVEMLILPKPENPLEALLGGNQDREREASVTAVLAAATSLAPELAQSLRLATTWRTIMAERACVMLPYWIEIH